MEKEKYKLYDLSPGEASEEEMELFAPSKSSSSEASRRKSSRGSDVSSSKGKFMVEDYKAKGGQGPKPQKEPLQFGPELYDDETWKCMSLVIGEANRVLWHWKSFPIVLPPPIESKIEPQHGTTASSMKKKTLNLKDLFVEPNFDESKTIALNSKGRLKRLSKEQLDSIRKTGEFEVDSVEFPGQKHRWLLTQILIKGNEKSRITMLNNLANCLYLVVGVSRDLCVRILESVNGWSVGTQNLFQMVFGCPLIDIVGLNAKLQTERSRHLVADFKEAPSEEGKVLALCNYILKTQVQSKIEEVDQDKSKKSAPPIPYRFLTPQGLEIDLRLCNQEVMRSLQPHLLHILNSAMQDWIPGRTNVLVKQFREEGITDPDELQFRLERTINNEYFDKVTELIDNSMSIARVTGHEGMKDKGVNQLLINQAKTAKIIGEVLAEEEKRQDKFKADLEANLRQDHPVLSRVDSWLKRQIRNAAQEDVLKHRWDPHQEAINRCKDASLDQSAYFLSKDLSFRKDHEPMWRKELRSLPTSQEPALHFNFKATIWNPKNWIVTEHMDSVNDSSPMVIPTEVLDNDGDDTLVYDSEKGSRKTDQNLSYSVEKNLIRTNNSGYLGWRWINFFLRTNAWFWNALFFFGVVLPWCTPFSLRALFYAEPFYPQYVLDPKTGVIRKDRASKTKTVRSRINDLWSHIAQSRKDFESKPDTGLLSKDISRHFHRFVNYILKGCCGTALILLCYPVLMILCSFGSLFLAVWTPIFIWVGSAFIHVLGFLFFDFESAEGGHEDNCFLRAVVWNVCVNYFIIGVLQPVFCSVVAFVFCPLLAFIGCALALVRKGIRDAWDTVMFQLVIKIHGRVPLQNNFLAKKISGPGMAKSYYYQIKQEQALVALETAMDLDRLAAVRSDLCRQIKSPEEDYEKFVKKYFGPLGTSITTSGNITNNPYAKLIYESKNLQNTLNEKVEKRRKYLGDSLPGRTKDRIRLTEDDLKEVLQQGTAIVQAFYTQQVFPRMTDEETRTFWAKKHLPKNDWLALTSHLYKDMFSPEFMIPLQDVDLTFALKVKHWNLSRYLNMAFEAEWRDDLDVARVMRTPKVTSHVQQPDIPSESFNPMAYPDLARSDRENMCKCLIYEKSKADDLGHKLDAIVPLPHPIEISVIISNRDGLSRSHLKLDQLKDNGMLRLMENSPSSAELSVSSPTSIKLAELSPPTKKPAEDSLAKDFTLRDESQSMSEMDQAMASLTQSLEELDRDVESDQPQQQQKRSSKGRLSLGGVGSHHNSPLMKKTGPGSVPLLASTEDISTAATISIEGSKSNKNPESYSTVV